jgi:RimJ/RimL family protein N-acetyltransferase
MNIETKRLVIRAAEQEDAKFLADLINDPEVRDSLGAYNLIFPTSTEMEARWIADVQKNPDQVAMIITMRATGKPVGLIALSDMNDRNASAHVSVMVERKSWSKGYGTEAISGLLERLFHNKNLHRVWLRVDESNHRAIKCYEKCGFRKEGVLREDHFAHGAWRSSYVMSVLADEFREGSS